MTSEPTRTCFVSSAIAVIVLMASKQSPLPSR
jgi:hypothetical protein